MSLNFATVSQIPGKHTSLRLQFGCLLTQYTDRIYDNSVPNECHWLLIYLTSWPLPNQLLVVGDPANLTVIILQCVRPLVLSTTTCHQASLLILYNTEGQNFGGFSWNCRKYVDYEPYDTTRYHEIYLHASSQLNLPQCTKNTIEALGQCLPPPRHVLPVSRYGCGSVSGSLIRIASKI